MNSQNYCHCASSDSATLQESRSQRFNLQVWHPPKWTLLLERLLASPTRIHRYRNLSRQIVERTLARKDCED